VIASRQNERFSKRLYCVFSVYRIGISDRIGLEVKEWMSVYLVERTMVMNKQRLVSLE
jgi:hypothetical protein